jgi:cellulose synthase/poly-beta-1,6-N-acetylglucosamine synthase-like glycosyltransferase
MSALWHMCVLIPARDEEELLPECLASVFEARRYLSPATSCDVVVAVDRSTDKTFDIANKMLKGKGAVVALNAGAVGEARTLAAEIALRRYDGPLDRCWLANTDADCCVPKSWLADQLMLCGLGAEAVAGTIDVVDFSQHAPGVEMRFRSSYPVSPDGTHSHVHGANFGVRADAYLRAGGWGSLCTAEDHDLWNRLADHGTRRVSIDRVKVLTSGRRVGRAPRGFAAALAAHNEFVYEP